MEKPEQPAKSAALNSGVAASSAENIPPPNFLNPVNATAGMSSQPLAANSNPALIMDASGNPVLAPNLLASSLQSLLGIPPTQTPLPVIPPVPTGLIQNTMTPAPSTSMFVDPVAVSAAPAAVPAPAALPSGISGNATLTSAIEQGVPVSVNPGASPESMVLNQVFVPVYRNTDKGPVIELLPMKTP